MELPRRHFFLLMGGALLQPAIEPTKRDMLVRSALPQDLEMPLSGFSEYVTPIDHFFVRTHVYVPRVTLSEWRLTVDGEVATPLTLTMDDVKRLPAIELMSVLECAGNGRGFYEPSVPGLQWSHGAVGNGRWRGVRLTDVLKRAGIKASAKEILFGGADAPLGTMPDFQRSIPVKKALDSSCVRDERRDSSGAARLPAARRGTGLGRRLLDQVADVDFCSRQGTRWVLDGPRVPASGQAG
jgi:DMSO/TMAO reductase YedYZ molybdopterin-dependent catalytic subunit